MADSQRNNEIGLIDLMFVYQCNNQFIKTTTDNVIMTTWLYLLLHMLALYNNFGPSDVDSRIFSSYKYN